MNKRFIKKISISFHNIWETQGYRKSVSDVGIVKNWISRSQTEIKYISVKKEVIIQKNRIIKFLIIGQIFAIILLITGIKIDDMQKTIWNLYKHKLKNKLKSQKYLYLSLLLYNKIFIKRIPWFNFSIQIDERIG